MKKVKELIEDFLKNDSDAFQFSFVLEDTLCEEYKNCYAEDPEKAVILDDIVPELCAEIEPEDDGVKFRKALKEVYDTVFTKNH